MSASPRLAASIAAVALLAAGCGDDTGAGTAPTTTGAPTAPTAPTDGGFGAPAAAPGEFGGLPGTSFSGTVEVAANGCWYLAGNRAFERSESALFIAPAGTRLGEDGASLITADGAVIGAGEAVDATGGFVPVSDLPGGADGRWGNYVASCEPSGGHAIVAETFGAAFRSSDVDPLALVQELNAARFVVDHPCGYGFATGDADGRWALRVDTSTATPPPSGTVDLPDERFRAVVTAGAHLFSNHCDDVSEWFEPTPSVAAEWPVVAGRFVYPPASADECAGGPAVMITLVGAVVDTPTGPVDLEPIEIENTAFGCFAG